MHFKASNESPLEIKQERFSLPFLLRHTTILETLDEHHQLQETLAVVEPDENLFIVGIDLSDLEEELEEALEVAAVDGGPLNLLGGSRLGSLLDSEGGQLEETGKSVVQFLLIVFKSRLDTPATKHRPDGSSDEEGLVAREIQPRLDSHQVFFGDSLLCLGLTTGDNLRIRPPCLDLHGAGLTHALLLPDVVDAPGGHPLLACGGHPLNHLHGVVLQREDGARVAHALLPLPTTSLADVLDLGLRGSFVLPGLAGLLSDDLREQLIVAALAVESPDAAPGTLTTCLEPGGSGVENHKIVLVLR